MKWTRFGFGVLLTIVVSCGGSQTKTNGREGAGERAGRKLDEAAAEVKKTGDEVGGKAGRTLGNAGENVKQKLGIDEARDAGAPPHERDGG